MSKAALVAEYQELQARKAAVTPDVNRAREQAYDLQMKKWENEENRLMRQIDLEEKFGGELVYSQEIPDFWFQRGISVREELPRAIEYADQYEGKPEGAKAYGVRTRDGENVVAYKMPGDRKFYAINAEGASAGDWGKYLGPAVSAESAMGAAVELIMPWGKTKPFRALYALGRGALRTSMAASAAAAGRGVDEVLEGLSDEEWQTWAQISSKMVESGAWGAAGHIGLAEPYEIIAGRIKRHGFSLKDLDRMSREGASPEELQAMGEALNLSTEEARKVISAQVIEGLDPLGLGELGSPLARRGQAQASGVSAEALEREKRKLSSTARKLLESEYAVGDIRDLDDASLARFVKNQERDARELMKRAFSKRGIDFSDTRKEVAGKTAAEAVLDYRKATSEEAARRYNKLLDLAVEEGVNFDMKAVKEAADAEMISVRLEGQPKEVKDRYWDIDGPKVEVRTVQDEIEFKRPLEAGLADVLQRISEVNDLQGPERLLALRQIRTNLRDLSEPDPRMITSSPSQASATRILHAFNEALTAPTNSKVFNDAAQQADAFWKERQANLDAFGYMRDINTIGAGERIYRRVVSADITEEEAKFLVKYMTKPRLDEFRSAVYTDLARHPEKINSTLAQMDRAGEALIPGPARAVLQEYRRAIEKINKGSAARLLEAQAEVGDRVSAVVRSGDAKAVRQLIDAEALSKRDVSMAMVRDFVENTTRLEEGLPVINRGAYESMIHKYETSGMMDFVEPRAAEMLRNFRLYESFLRKGGDVGDALASAAIASDVLRAAQNPLSAAKAGFRIYQLGIISRIAHSPIALKVVKGKDVPETFAQHRALILLGTITARQLNQDKREQ